MTQPIVLVTGAAGFIGRHIARKFAAEGWVVQGLGRGRFPDYSDWGIKQWMQGDVSAGSLHGCTHEASVIVHCAGGASVGRSVELPAEDFVSTVQSTSAVLEFIRTTSPQSRLIYPSSAAVYGQVEHFPIIENGQANPISPYGFHKLMSESLCSLYAKQYGLKCVVLRLFSIYGPELRKQLLWDACEKLSRGDSTFFGTGREIRDWLYIEDLVNLAYAALPAASIQCPVLNAASGAGVTVAEILDTVKNNLSISLPLIFTSANKAGDPKAMIAEISRALALNWVPKMSLKEGIANYVEWYKKCQ